MARYHSCQQSTLKSPSPPNNAALLRNAATEVSISLRVVAVTLCNYAPIVIPGALNEYCKPKNQRSKRFLRRKEPQIEEPTKTAMFIRGKQTSDVVNNVLKEVYLTKKPNAVMLNKKNPVRPFEDFTSVEFFSNKNESSLFMIGSHSKKRPHNLVIGHLFDYHLLDMFEFGVENFQSMTTFQNAKLTLGNKPCLIFSGEPFESDFEHKRLKYLLINFFRGPVVQNVRLAGLEHIISFTAVDGRVVMKTFKALLKKSGTKTPRVELDEIGPSMELVMRRKTLAATDLYKKSLKVPAVAKPKKKKNISQDAFKSIHGRIHMEKQDMSNFQTRKMKGLKRTKERKEEPAKRQKTEEGTGKPTKKQRTTRSK